MVIPPTVRQTEYSLHTVYTLSIYWDTYRHTEGNIIYMLLMVLALF